MNDFFTIEAFSKHFDAIRAWMVLELPMVIILIVGLFILLRIVKAAVSRLKSSLLKRASKMDSSDPIEAEKRINTLMNIIWAIVKMIILLTFGMIILQKFGVNVGPIIASAGILGLAVGFGAQQLVKDVISGFFILLENQIRTGDAAVINGTAGTVEVIQLRTTTLRDFSGTVHIFQNGKINMLSNKTKEWSAAVFDIGVAYKEDVQHVSEVMKNVGEILMTDIEFAEKITTPMEIMGLDQFGDSALVIKARIKTRPGMQWVVTREYNKRLKLAFDAENIEIPYPHRTLVWENDPTLLINK
ncbi:MAG: small-conductance mechanosensitive channel [Saprospiraceae bacterium]|jgi:small-conductance mechanosensitive channel|tara:strand:+ start:974 stop:1876 length:903 start_codon:yes stop_codon:yes gene_type:complete